MTPEVQAAAANGRWITAKMIEADASLYEKILDTPGFAFWFNQLVRAADAYIAILPPGPRPEHLAATLVGVFLRDDGKTLDGIISDGSGHVFATKSDAILAAWHDAHEAYLRQVEGFRKGLA